MFSTLMYHEIRRAKEFDPEHPSSIDVRQDYNDILPSPLFITLEKFEEQMAFLRMNRYHTLSLEEVKGYFHRKERLPGRSVLLTFDDCYQSVKKYAYPVLKQFGFHAVAFVVTGWLHNKPKEFNPGKSVCMAGEELAEMADVFEYANHTDSFHRRTDETTSIITETGDEEFSRDLDACNESGYIQAKDVFAYPFGLYNERNVALLNKKGFLLAFTSESGFNDENTHPLLLKRNAVPYFISPDAFKETIG